MTKIKSLFIALILSLGVSSAFADGHGSTLDVVKERGFFKMRIKHWLSWFW
jgi:hypothetical protein